MEGEEVIGEKKPIRVDPDRDQVRVKRKTIEAVLQQCQMALQQLNSDCGDDVDDDDDARVETGCSNEHEGHDDDDDDDVAAAEICSLLKSRVDRADFLEKIENAQAMLPQNTTDESSTWDVVSENDLWDSGNAELDTDDYILVREEDIVEGLACFMAAYLLSLKQTKELTPNQLQKALSKTFGVKKKGKLRKAWDGSKIIYNVASWGATAIGVYQNPALLKAASAAFWTSCHVISKLF